MMKRDDLKAQKEPLRQLTDGRLLEQAAQGLDAAFEELIRRYQSSLYQLACSYLQCDDAHDVLQETWIRLFASLSKLAAEQNNYGGTIKSWLFQVTRRRCIDRLRERFRRRQLIMLFSELAEDENEEEPLRLSYLPDPSPSAEDQYLEREAYKAWLPLIAALPPKYRSVFCLRLIGLRHEEIGSMLQQKEATVKIQYRRARKILQKNIYTHVLAR
jgi:RNA polymerase sigma-70 factor, ECF subfamily